MMSNAEFGHACGLVGRCEVIDAFLLNFKYLETVGKSCLMPSSPNT